MYYWAKPLMELMNTILGGWKSAKIKKDFFIAVEGDWPDYKLNRYIKNYPTQGIW
jgi:hypothetical protein